MSFFQAGRNVASVTRIGIDIGKRPANLNWPCSSVWSFLKGAVLAIEEEDRSAHLRDAQGVADDAGDGAGKLDGSDGKRTRRSGETRHPQYQGSNRPVRLRLKHPRRSCL